MAKFLTRKFQLNYLSFLSNAWVLAILPALVISLLLPEFFQKYNLELKQTYNRESDKLLTFFEDVEQDGVKEKVDILNYRNLFASCYFWEEHQSLKRQLNFYGKLPKQENLNIPIFCDVTNDGIKELFVFTQKDDSLFLNVVDFSVLEVIVYGRFISKIGVDGSNQDFVLRPIINHDYNHDQIPEIYFLLNGGYSLNPRKILAYDFANDTLISTINTGSQHYVTPVLMENDELALISTTPATNNIPEDYPAKYIDSCAWIFSFNDRLELNYEPLAFTGITCKVFGPVVVNNEFHFSVRNQGKLADANFMISVNEKGEILDKKEISEKVFCSNLIAIESGGNVHQLFNCTENNYFNIYEYNPSELKLEKSGFVKNLPKASLVPFSIDKDNRTFFAFNPSTDNFSLFLDDYTQEVAFDAKKPKLYIVPYNLYAQSSPTDLGELIMVTSRDYLYTYLLSKSKLYPLRYGVFLLVYLVNVCFILLIQYLQRRRLHVQEQLEKEISSLQLQLVKTQLDPHFMFNVLNTVSSKILKGERFEAYDLMISFSNLMRLSTVSSEKDKWKLEDEIKFTHDYLRIMKVRFKSLFDFSLVVDDEVNQSVNVPRLIVQNFAENAIKHAFNGLEYPGMLDIQVSRVHDSVEILITDNGIGREKAMENTADSLNRSGQGILLNGKQIDIFNRLYQTNVRFKIEDLYAENKPCGTRIQILIPLD